MLKNINELEEKYQVKLDDVQLSALSSLINFIENGVPDMICLSGKPGSGKTTILKMLIDILHRNRILYTVAAPTNKAKLLLNNDATTIHSLLGFAPNLNILEFDARDLQFKQQYSAKLPYQEVVIVDECSMINDEMFYFFRDRMCKTYKNIIIWSGDEKQLCPVKQNHISKTFTDCHLIKLEKVYRQKESVLYKVLDYLRVKPLYKFKSVEDDNYTINVCDNINTILDTYTPLFKFASDSKNLNCIKLVTYTNNRISALNQVIRKRIYNDDSEYHVGEILTGYDTCYYKPTGCSIDNSQDYIIDRVKKITHLGLPMYELKLFDGYDYKIVRILSRNLPNDVYESLARDLENARQKGLQTKSWGKFYGLNSSFLTPVDLIYNNRVIKRKSLDYGYCISTHKSQGSTYQFIIVDMENLLRCPNKEELRQLQYVAMSRASGGLIIYYKNNNNDVY